MSLLPLPLTVYDGRTVPPSHVGLLSKFGEEGDIPKLRCSRCAMSPYRDTDHLLWEGAADLWRAELRLHVNESFFHTIDADPTLLAEDLQLKAHTFVFAQIARTANSAECAIVEFDRHGVDHIDSGIQLVHEGMYALHAQPTHKK